MTDAKPPIRPRRRARRTLFGVLAVLVVAGVAQGLAWHWATSALAVGFSDWVTQRRAEGWQVAHGPQTRGGWPFAARLMVEDVRIAAPSRDGQAGFAHHAARVVLQLAPPQIDRLAILFEGPQRLVLGGMEVPFAAERLVLRVQIAPGLPPPAIDVTATSLQALLPAGPVALRAARVSIQAAAPGATMGMAAARAAEAEPALAISVAAQGLALPSSAATMALGNEVEALSIDALLVGPLPLPGPPAVAAAAWRDAGGALDIPSLALRWGPLVGEGRLALALDGALQPAGSGTLRVVGAAETLDALARAGLIGGSAARTARAVAVLLARPPPEGGPPRVELPVALANGTLSVARVPLVRLAPIAWPAPRAW